MRQPCGGKVNGRLPWRVASGEWRVASAWPALLATGQDGVTLTIRNLVTRHSPLITSQCFSVRADSQSISARSTPETTKARWMMTPHIASVSFSG